MYFKGNEWFVVTYFRQICHWKTFAIIIYSLNDSVSDVKHLPFTISIDFAPQSHCLNWKDYFWSTTHSLSGRICRMPCLETWLYYKLRFSSADILSSHLVICGLLRYCLPSNANVNERYFNLIFANQCFGSHLSAYGEVRDVDVFDCVA
jgi:hypothetical protein